MKHIVLLLFLVSQLHSQEVPQYAPLTKQEWDLCETFILEKADNFFKKGTLTISPQEDLPYPIEKDPTTEAIYIHLKDHPQGFLGKGVNKIVSKSIMYGPNAFVIARCEANHSGKNEAKILKKLKKIQGVNHLFSIIPRMHGQYDLFIEYANKGNMCRAQYGKLPLSPHDLLSVLFDLTSGLMGVHKKGYIHRDLKRSNVFLYTKEGLYHGMIADLGCAIPIKSTDDKTFCIPDETTPPEIYLKPFSKINRIQSETYSLGVLLYMLVFEKRPPWLDLIQKKFITTLSEAEKFNTFQKITAIYEQVLTNELQQLQEERKEIAKVVLQMLRPEPKKRPTLIRVQKQLKNCIP